MSIYTQLGKTPGALRLVLAQLIARFPMGMLSLVLLLHIELKFHNYSSAGLVLSVLCIGQALSGPVTSRWMGRWGMRQVLSITTLVCGGAMATIALVPLPLLGVLAVAFLLGFSIPPVSPAARTIYPKLVPGKLLSGLYALDATAQEIIWALGPVLAVFVAVQFSPTAALLICSLLLFIGGAFFIFSPEVGRVRIPQARRKLGAVFKRKTVMLSTLVGFLYLISFSAMEAGVVAIFGHEGTQGGMILGINAAGSFIGGLIVGHRALSRWSLTTRMLIVMFGTALCIFSNNTLWLCVVLFIAGMGAAPTFAALSSLISSTVKFSETAEAFGWSATGQLVGAAVGSALAGVAIDIFQPRGAFIVATIAIALAIIVAAIGSKLVPDLRGKDASPIPDTEPISTVPPEAIA